MSYWFEKEKVKTDRRVKLTEENRKEIKLLAGNGWSQRKLAREFEVSRRAIVWVLYPERLELNRLGKDWKRTYNKKKHAAYIRKYRAHKKEEFGLKRR